MLNPFLSSFLQVLLVILLAPLVNGIIRQIKAKAQHRKGAPLLQLYFDLVKLMKKDVVISENASWIFRVTPYIYLFTALAAAIFIPVIPQLFSFSFAGDGIMVIYLLAAGRFFMVLSGLDTGSTFGGMGSSREMMISALIEPSIIVTVITSALSLGAGNSSFIAIYAGAIKSGTGIINPVNILLLAAMFIVLIAETARIPVDDPSTHLELTMVHEAMLLEYSGRYLAFMQLGASIKQLVLITMIANLFLPFGNSFALGVPFIGGLLLFIMKMFLIAAVVGLIEINSVKLRLFSVPNLAALAFIMSLLGFLTGFVFRG